MGIVSLFFDIDTFCQTLPEQVGQRPMRPRWPHAFAVPLGKTSTGWFYGLKLHLIVNDPGELLAFWITPGNVDDRRLGKTMSRGLFGLLVGDRGYIGQDIFRRLYQRGTKLVVTRIKRNMAY